MIPRTWHSSVGADVSFTEGLLSNILDQQDTFGTVVDQRRPPVLTKDGESG